MDKRSNRYRKHRKDQLASFLADTIRTAYLYLSHDMI